MKKPKTFMEKTAASGTGAAFDYQYYYFLYKILNLRMGQSVGLEIKDDVHTDMDNDLQLLFQLKHTVQKKADGAPVCLTELDVDLWKTLYNWASVVSDPNDGRTTVEAQLCFISRTEFHLVTNKSESGSNFFVELLIRYFECDTLENFNSLTSRMKELSVSTSDRSIRFYIDVVLGLSEQVKKEFFKKIYLEMSEIEIIKKIKTSIAEKFVPLEKIDYVYDRLNSNIRDDGYMEMSAGRSFSINFSDFGARYWKIFQDARENKLSSLRFEPALPSDLLNQNFILQLIAVGDLCSNDTDIVTEYSTHKVRLVRSLEQWEQGGEVVYDEIQAMHDDVHVRWKNNHRMAYRSYKPEEVEGKGLAIVDAMRSERYRLGRDELSTEYSNGELYELSDIGRIGWHRDWKVL